MTKNKLTDEVLTKLKLFDVAHHVKGRLRLKAGLSLLTGTLFEQTAEDSSEQELDDIVSSLPGVTDSRINLKARSVVVRYDPNVISPDDINALITSGDISTKKEILEKYKINHLKEEIADVQ